jgi:predicted aspartyl protease
MKLSWTVANVIALASVCGMLVLKPLPNLAQNPLTGFPRPAIAASNRQPATKQAQQPAQQPAPAPNPLGKELLQQLLQCVVGTVSNPQQPSAEQLQTASTQCLFKVVMLAPDGSVRPDASARLTALLKTTGITLPKPVSQGQASVPIKPLTDSQVFTVPVKIAGQPKTFLLDTGASNSILDSQIAQQLKLAGTPITSDILAYMVVGDNCSNVKATLHSLPPLSVDSAKVEGLNGMGLSKTAIPGQQSGVLGMDFLSGFDVIINPKTLQLQLLPHSRPPAGAIPLTGKMGVMTAEVQINGKGAFTFLLDTGADTMVVSQRLAQRLSLDTAKAKDTEVRGFCGTETGKQITLEGVNLHGRQATNLDAVILENGVLDLLGVEGIIGQNFLTRYRQHWRFEQFNQLGFPDAGSLVLTPL